MANYNPTKWNTGNWTGAGAGYMLGGPTAGGYAGAKGISPYQMLNPIQAPDEMSSVPMYNVPDYAAAGEARLNAIPISQEGINAYRQLALSAGPTEGTAMALRKGQQDYLSKVAGVDKANSGRLASAYSQLASHGGASTGASERLSAKAMQQGMIGRQGLAANQASNVYDALMKNAAERQAAIKGLPQAEYLNTKQFTDRANSINDMYRAMEQQRMEAFANNQLANAQIAQLNKEDPGLLGMGGLLGTGVGGKRGVLGLGVGGSSRGGVAGGFGKGLFG